MTVIKQTVKSAKHFSRHFLLSAALAASLPVFGNPGCDQLVGDYAKKENGEVWLRIEKVGTKYLVNTKGAILNSDQDKTGKWGDKPPLEFDGIPRERLETFKELNQGKPIPDDMCGLESTLKIAILRVPIGYRYGEDADEISKTGYLLAVYAGAYGLGTRDIYRVK